MLTATATIRKRHPWVSKKVQQTAVGQQVAPVDEQQRDCMGRARSHLMGSPCIARGGRVQRSPWWRRRARGDRALHNGRLLPCSLLVPTSMGLQHA